MSPKRNWNLIRNDNRKQQRQAKQIADKDDKEQKWGVVANLGDGGWNVFLLIWVLQDAFIKFLVANVLKFSKPMYRQRVKGPLDLRKLSWDGRDYLLFRDTSVRVAAKD